MKSLLIATQHESDRQIIERCFQSGYRAENAESQQACFERLAQKRFEYLFVDLEWILQSGENDIKKQLQPYWRTSPGTEIIVLASPEQIRQAVDAVKAGAANYLTHPVNPEELRYVVDSLVQFARFHSELDYLRSRFWRKDSISLLRTHSPSMKDVFDKVRAVAETESTVLLTGETGTGKSMIAKLIHQHSPRSDNQFISVHCGAIPETLLESELFGHEKGAFTGAVRRKLGKFEIAQDGTIFLDEIGTITQTTQIKLLHVLQDHSIQRLGSESAVIQCDVRVLVATNADLKALCEQGLFRQDLYYRLNVFPIDIPPLRERIEDLPFMIEMFIKRLNQKYAKAIRDVHPEVLNAFKTYAWPGNIRELENLIERAYILEQTRTLSPKSFPAELFGVTGTSGAELDLSCPLEVHRDREIERAEFQYLSAQLKKHNGRINETASASGLGVRQLHKLLKKHGILKEDYKTSVEKLSEP